MPRLRISGLEISYYDFAESILSSKGNTNSPVTFIPGISAKTDDYLILHTTGSGKLGFTVTDSNTFTEIPLDDKVISGSISESVYDADPSTYQESTPGPNSTNVPFILDFGSITTRGVYFHTTCYGVSGSYRSYIDVSNDNSAWTTILSQIGDGTKQTFTSSSFRYLRWRVQNTYFQSGSSDYVRLYELAVISGDGIVTAPNTAIRSAPKDVEEGYAIVFYDGSSTVDFTFTHLAKRV